MLLSPQYWYFLLTKSIQDSVSSKEGPFKHSYVLKLIIENEAPEYIWTVNRTFGICYVNPTADIRNCVYYINIILFFAFMCFASAVFSEIISSYMWFTICVACPTYKHAKCGLLSTFITHCIREMAIFPFLWLLKQPQHDANFFTTFISTTFSFVVSLRAATVRLVASKDSAMNSTSAFCFCKVSERTVYLQLYDRESYHRRSCQHRALSYKKNWTVSPTLVGQLPIPYTTADWTLVF